MKSAINVHNLRKQEKEVLKTIGNKADPAQTEKAILDFSGMTLFTIEQLEDAISKARDQLLSLQSAQGHWVFDLEADCTIPSEYVLVQRFLGRELRPELFERLSRYLRRRQLPDGGWSLYEDGFANISATVKAYFSLKLMGDSPNAPHMVRARQLILSLGGAARVNVASS